MGGRHTLLRRFVIFIAVVVLLAAMSLCYGDAMQKTYVDDTDFERYLQDPEMAVLYYHYPYDENYDVYGGGEEVSNYQELTDTADLIVKVKLKKDMKRSIYEECILSAVAVQETYQGDAKKGDVLHLFEPVNCTGMVGLLLCSEGYSPMQQGKEYVLFLKRLKDALYSGDKYVYLPSTLTYSKYEVSDNVPKKFSSADLEYEKLGYADVKGEEVFLYDKKMYKKFLGFKKQVMSEYQLHR